MRNKLPPEGRNGNRFRAVLLFGFLFRFDLTRLLDELTGPWIIANSADLRWRLTASIEAGSLSKEEQPCIGGGSVSSIGKRRSSYCAGSFFNEEMDLRSPYPEQIRDSTAGLLNSVRT